MCKQHVRNSTEPIFLMLQKIVKLTVYLYETYLMPICKFLTLQSQTLYECSAESDYSNRILTCVAFVKFFFVSKSRLKKLE